MSGVSRYAGINGHEYVLASDYDRDTQRLSDESHRNRVDLVDAVERSDKLRAERDELRAQNEAMRAALEKISAYAPCSGMKDPGFTKMHMGILARDAIEPALQAKP